MFTYIRRVIYIFVIILCLIIAYFIYNNKKNNQAVYNLGTEIDLSVKGQSERFINTKYSWGGQEKKWRCTVGKESIIHMYVNNGQNTTLNLNVDGFGVFNKELTNYQQITVFANNQQIAEWKVAGDDTYTAIIPATVMKTNELELRFKIAKPYSPAGDSRKLGMAVKRIVITKKIAPETRRKIARWVKRQFDKIYHETPEEKKLRQEQWKEWTEGN